MKQALLLSIATATVIATGASASDEWPMFRGPNASGVSETAKPPVEFGPEKNVVWKAEVPWSPSSPCVWKDRLFLTTLSEGRLETRCYSTSNGNLVWTKAAPSAQLEDFHPTDGSPILGESSDGRAESGQLFRFLRRGGI